MFFTLILTRRKTKLKQHKPQNNFNMLVILLSKEDPRLKIPAHLRRKTSLDPVDLGPLPVSKPFYLFFRYNNLV